MAEAVDQESEAFSLATPPSGKRKRTAPFASNEPSVAAAEILPESICQVCLNLGNEVWDLSYREGHGLGTCGPHCKPVWEVAITAQKGCPGCEIIAWALEPYMERLQDNGQQVDIDIGHAGQIFMGVLTYFCRKSSEDGLWLKLVFKSTPFEFIESARPHSNNLSSPWHSIPLTPMVTRHTGSAAAVRRVKDWYSDCLSGHQRCLSGSRSPLPTRVIHIQGPNRVKLFSSDTQVAEYACLSHCWGGQAVIQTTTRNFDQYTVNIPWEKLPKTFKDAIQFASSIGFKYLWIDSLCIIQDSIDDWRHEGSRMSSIYADASMTLSATWAANPHQGCFVTLDERFTSRTKTFTDSDDKTYELHCHEVLGDMKTPLFERGWVFQERMLSTRIVHFMEQELWWECRECFHCECDGFDHRFDRRDRQGTLELSELSPLESIERNWEHLIETYSSKSLTYPGDIFPAVQALAKLIPSKMGRYLAGHWEGAFISSLGWLPSKPIRNKHNNWRAPSWSWAAAQGPVAWRMRYNRPIIACATLLSALTIPKGDDPMGQISYGLVVLRGKVLTGRIQEPGSPFDNGLTLDGERIDKFPDFKFMWDRMTSEGVGKEVLALELFDEGSEAATVFQSWLILEAVEGGKGEYVRTGLLHAYISLVDDNYAKLPAQLVESYKGAWAAITDRAVEMDLKIV